MRLFYRCLLSLLLIGSSLFASTDTKHKLNLTFFGSSTCGECMQIKEVLLKPLAAKYDSTLYIHFCDIDNDTMFKLQTAMEKKYNVKESFPQELFFPDTVLQGFTQIMKDGKPLIEYYLAHPEKWPSKFNPDSSLSDTVSTAAAIKEKLSTFTIIGLFAAGFIDGVNPCAIGTMIFLISFLGTQNRTRKDVLKIGIAFSATVFLTYFSIGLGTFRMLTLLKNYWIATGIRIFAVGFATIVAIICVWDAIRYRKTGDTRDLKDQLPKGVKLLIHSVIKNNLSSNKIVAGAIIAGFFVTLLEGVCTAKIYLPTIVLMTHHFGFRLFGWLLLVFYNFLFVLPLLIVLILAAYGMKWTKLSKFTQKHLSLMKLMLALILLSLATFISIDISTGK